MPHEYSYDTTYIASSLKPAAKKSADMLERRKTSLTPEQVSALQELCRVEKLFKQAFADEIAP